MKVPDIIFDAAVIMFLGTVLVLFFKGKPAGNGERRSARPRRYIPLITVLVLLIATGEMIYYYTVNGNADREKYHDLLTAFYQRDIVLNENKKESLDSLRIYRQQLVDLLARIKKGQHITGEASRQLSDAENLLQLTDKEIEKVKGYNDVADIKTLFPLMKGHVPGIGDTALNVACPRDMTTENAGIVFNLTNRSFVDSIACIYVEVLHRDRVGYNVIYDRAYIPRLGLNVIGLKNDPGKKNIELRIGYYLKADKRKEYPSFRCKVCAY